MNSDGLTFRPDPKLMRFLSLVALTGLAVTTAGLFIVPQRIWPNILLSAYYLLGLGIAGVLFVALVYLSNAGWATAIRRVPEAMAANVYAGGVLMAIVLLGVHHLYEWSHEAAVEADLVLRSKAAWLNVPFFSARTVLYVVLWSGCTWLIVRTSRKQDTRGDAELTTKNRRYAGIFIVVFVLTFWIASMDWIMSIEPHWYSTIFGVYNFSGLFLSGIAMITILTILLRRAGVLRGIVREEHLHDMGKLLFAFSTFWMYIWFSQYILVWYSNIPEETTYFIRRENGGWGTFTVLNVVFNWAIPFIFLISRVAKRNEGLLLKICVAVLIGHWIDLFWMIVPPFMPETPNVNIWEIAPLAGAISLFFLVTYRTLTRASAVPLRDPMLVESLHYHT